MNHVSAAYPNANGEQLAYHCWETSSTAYDRVVLFVHGLGLHSTAHPTVPRFFTARGYKVYAPDLYGFGQSPGERGRIDRFDRWVDDVDRLYRSIIDREGYREVVFLGHSLGALVVLSLATRYPDEDLRILVAAPLLSSPLWRGSGGVDLDMSDLVADGEARSRLESDSAIVRSLDHGLLDAAREGAESVVRGSSSFGRVKCLLAHGDFDPIAPVEDVSTQFSSMRFRESSRFTFPKMRHDLFDDPASERVFEALDRWLVGTVYD